MPIKLCEDHYYDPYEIEKTPAEKTFGENICDLFKSDKIYNSCSFCRSGLGTIQQLPIRDRIGFWLRRQVANAVVGGLFLGSYLFYAALIGGRHTACERRELMGESLCFGGVSAVILTYFIAHKVANSIFKNHYVQI